MFKALSDPNRLMIMDMLSCGELCACEILCKLGITQPTLSHHMGILCGCGLVKGRRDGKWTYYSQDGDAVGAVRAFLEDITTAKPDCICRRAGAEAADRRARCCSGKKTGCKE